MGEKIDAKWKKIHKKMIKIIKERYKKKELKEQTFLQIEESQKIKNLENEREKIEEKYEYDRKRHEEQKKIAQKMAIIRSWKMIAEKNKPLREKEKIGRKRHEIEEKKIKNMGLKKLSRNTPTEKYIDIEYEKKIHIATEKEKVKITNEIEDIRAKAKKREYENEIKQIEYAANRGEMKKIWDFLKKMKMSIEKKTEKKSHQTLQRKDGTLTKTSAENLNVWKEWVKDNFYRDNTTPKIEYTTEEEINNDGIFELLNEEDKYKEYRNQNKDRDEIIKIMREKENKKLPQRNVKHTQSHQRCNNCIKNRQRSPIMDLHRETCNHGSHNYCNNYQLNRHRSPIIMDLHHIDVEKIRVES